MDAACLVFVMRIFLEILDMWESHSCACTCSAIVIRLAVVVSCLKVSVSGGSYANETSCEISASVFTWKLPVRLMTMGMILTSPLSLAVGCRRFVMLVGMGRIFRRCVL